MRFLVLVVLVGCAPTERPRSDEVLEMPDAAVVTTEDAPTPSCYELATEVDVASTVQIEESCAIWNSLDAFPGTAVITKTGSIISITFDGAVVFAGPLVGNSVSLAYNHDHSFSDGCGWRAAESMVGTLDPTTCAFTLAYDYAEYVVQSDGACAAPCSANADVDLELVPVVIL